jgi:hypothetical protein
MFLICAAVVGRCRSEPQAKRKFGVAKYRFFSVKRKFGVAKCVLFNGFAFCVVGENAIQRHDYP